MLEKYQHFKKITKTEKCSFYDAEDRTIMQSVLLKRLPDKSTWDELLTNRNLLFMNKAQFGLKMVQIFKKKGYYFVVFQKPTGYSLSQPQKIGKLPLHKFYPLFYDLCQSCIQIKQQSPLAYIMPEWVFINRNLCKIGHFQPFFGTDGDDGLSKHVFMYNVQKTLQANNLNTSENIQTAKFERRQSLVYNLGIIAYHLLTGKNSMNSPMNDQQYMRQVTELQSECFKRLQKATKDEKFAQMISKMIKQDPFDCPTLNEVFNFSKRKSKQYEPKNTNNPTLQFDLEKIQLLDKYPRQNLSPPRKIMLRPCCKTVQNQQAINVQVQKKGNLTLAYVKRDFKHSHLRTRSFLPEISQTTQRNRYKSKQSFTKGMMLKSEGNFKLKEV